MIHGAIEQVGAVTRTVRSCEHEGKPARALVATQEYPSEMVDVWDAVTNPERIPRWFLPISGDLKVGGRYQFEGNAGGVVRECDPPRSFSVTWEFGGQVSWLEVRLTEPTEGRTSLQLEHIVHVDEQWEQFGPGAVGVGWDSGLLGLSNHLASGAAVDPREAMAWMASEEGREFMTSSSDAWCEANIAAGANEADARAAAARTTAAYTTPPPAPEPRD